MPLEWLGPLMMSIKLRVGVFYKVTQKRNEERSLHSTKQVS